MGSADRDLSAQYCTINLGGPLLGVVSMLEERGRSNYLVQSAMFWTAGESPRDCPALSPSRTRVRTRGREKRKNQGPIFPVRLLLVRAPLDPARDRRPRAALPGSPCRRGYWVVGRSS